MEPGDELTDSALVSSGALEPLGVTTLESDGLTWFNQFGRTWQGDTLLAYRSERSSVVTAGTPGAKQLTMAATNDGPLQAVVLQRGVAVVTQDGCSLATEVTEAKPVGEGSCQISDDERWVVSWPGTPGALTIRDLRNDSTRKVTGIETNAAVVLSRDARSLAVINDGDGVKARVIDNRDGSTVAETDTYQRMQPLPGTAGATGFVALAQAGDTIELLWISTDGKVSVIDSGIYMLPVQVTGQVTYLRLDEDPTKDSVRRWSPGGEPETLLTGRVGASSPTPDSLLVTRDTDDGVEFFRSAPSGELEKVLTLDADTEQGSLIANMYVQQDVALLQVSTGMTTSFVRIDLKGDGSDAPIQNRQYLLLESVDVDGTALLTGADGPDEGEQILVVGPHDDSATVRARADSTGANLIHEGVVYWTDQTQSGDISVRSVRAAGDKDETVLYKNRQIAGATWPQNNGATEGTVVSRAAVTQSQQQQQSQSQSQG